MTDALVKELELKAVRSTFDKFRNDYKLDNADLGAALQVDRRTIQRYRSGDSYPTRRVRNGLVDLREISILLGEIFSTQEGAVRWLNTSVPLLKGRLYLSICPWNLADHGSWKPRRKGPLGRNESAGGDDPEAFNR